MTEWFQSGMLGEYGGWFVANTILILLIALPLMLSVALIIYAERKLWAAFALRRGPNVVGPLGILQSFADAVRYQRRAALYSRGKFAWRLRCDHRGLGVKFEISLLFGTPRRSTNGEL
jgi:NADH:ubiquinone oxidoreductase subunit H